MRRLRLIPILLLAACSRGSDDTVAQDFTSDFAHTTPALMEPGPAAAPAPPRFADREVAHQSVGKGSGSRPVVPGAVAGTAVPAGAPLHQSPAIIRTGNASVEVAHLDSAVASVRRLAAALGGYVANTTLQGGQDQVRSAMVELKLPAERFDQAVAGLDPVGDVESVSVEAQDVGEELVDLEARIANARRLEERLVELLATRTGRLEDVLAVERELARVREEIERLEGRLRYLRSRVAVSTLVVALHEPQPILGHTDNPIAEAVRDAWRNFVATVAVMIAGLGTLLPVAIVVGAVVLIAQRILRRRDAMNQRASSGLLG